MIKMRLERAALEFGPDLRARCGWQTVLQPIVAECKHQRNMTSHEIDMWLPIEAREGVVMGRQGPTLHRAEGVHRLDDLRNETTLVLKTLGHIEMPKGPHALSKAFLIMGAVAVLRELQIFGVRRVRDGGAEQSLGGIDLALPIRRRRQPIPACTVCDPRAICLWLFRKPACDLVHTLGRDGE